MNAVQFSHAYGNHLGTLHFIWRVRFSLISSVAVVVDIPAAIDESFHRGQVYVGLKDLVLEPSAALRHAIKFSRYPHNNYYSFSLLHLY